MGSRKTFTLNILNQNGVVLYGEYEALLVPTPKGETAIMTFHTPAIMLLSPGAIKVHENHGFKEVTKVEAGLVYVGENEVTVLIHK